MNKGRERERGSDRRVMGETKKQRQQRKAGEEKGREKARENREGEKSWLDHWGEQSWCQHLPSSSPLLDIKVGASKAAASVAASIVITSSLNAWIHHKNMLKWEGALMSLCVTYVSCTNHTKPQSHEARCPWLTARQELVDFLAMSSKEQKASGRCSRWGNAALFFSCQNSHFALKFKLEKLLGKCFNRAFKDKVTIKHISTRKKKN